MTLIKFLIEVNNNNLENGFTKLKISQIITHNHSPILRIACYLL